MKQSKNIKALERQGKQKNTLWCRRPSKIRPGVKRDVAPSPARSGKSWLVASPAARGQRYKLPPKSPVGAARPPARESQPETAPAAPKAERTVNSPQANVPVQRKSESGDSRERLELLLNVSIQKLADRERLIEALYEAIVNLQRDTMV
jgi:hypothetical protein